MTPSDGHLPPPASLVERLRAAGAAGPVFVVADNAAIGSRAPDWARLLAAAGWVHRVRFWEGTADDAAVEALAAEVRGFGARAIVAGSAATRAVACDVAAATRLPCVIDGP